MEDDDIHAADITDIMDIVTRFGFVVLRMNHAVNYDGERDRLYELIPRLFEERKEELSIAQLRLLHFILGYRCKNDPADLARIMYFVLGYRCKTDATEQGDILERFDLTAKFINAIMELIQDSDMIVFRSPYPLW